MQSWRCVRCTPPMAWTWRLRVVPGPASLDHLWARGRALLGTSYAILGGAMTWVSERNLVAAISNGLILEFYRDTVDPMWGKVYEHTLMLNADGTVSPPNVPGIGADPRYDTLAPYRIA